MHHSTRLLPGGVTLVSWLRQARGKWFCLGFGPATSVLASCFLNHMPLSRTLTLSLFLSTPKASQYLFPLVGGYKRGRISPVLLSHSFCSQLNESSLISVIKSVKYILFGNAVLIYHSPNVSWDRFQPLAPKQDKQFPKMNRWPEMK